MDLQSYQLGKMCFRSQHTKPEWKEILGEWKKLQDSVLQVPSTMSADSSFRLRSHWLEETELLRRQVTREGYLRRGNFHKVKAQVHFPQKK